MMTKWTMWSYDQMNEAQHKIISNSRRSIATLEAKLRRKSRDVQQEQERKQRKINTEKT